MNEEKGRAVSFSKSLIKENSCGTRISRRGGMDHEVKEETCGTARNMWNRGMDQLNVNVADTDRDVFNSESKTNANGAYGMNKKRSRTSDFEEFPKHKTKRRRTDAAYCASPDYNPYTPPKRYLSQPKLHLGGTPPSTRRFAKTGCSSLYETASETPQSLNGVNITETREASRASFYLGSGDIASARFHLCGDDHISSLKYTFSSLKRKKESGILVTGLSTDVTAQEVWAHFSPIGKLVAFAVNEGHNYKKFAELAYQTCGEAEQAILLHHGSYLFGPVTHVGYRGQNRDHFNTLERSFLQQTARYRVMVTNLPTGSRTDLLDRFSNLGQILSVATYKGRWNSGRYYFYGFVFFSSADLATTAIATLNGAYIRNYPINVYPYRPPRQN